MARAIRPALVAVAVMAALQPSAYGFNPSEQIGASTLRNTNPAPLGDLRDLADSLYGSVTVSAEQHQNVFRTERNEKSDVSLGLGATLGYRNTAGRHPYYAEYRGAYDAYNDFSDESGSSHTVGAGIELDMTERLNGYGRVTYTDGREDRGTPGTVPGSLDDRDRFTETAGELGLAYGNRLRVYGGIGIAELRYKNNAQSSRNRDSDFWRLGVSYAVSPRTALFAEMSENDIQYVDQVGLNQDSTETFYGGGVSWQPSARTAAIVRVGNTKKDMDDPAQMDFSDLTWDGRISYAIKPYSTVSFYAARSTEESTEATSAYVVSDLYGLSWNHTFRSSTGLTVYGSVTQDEFTDGRKDDYTEMGVAVTQPIGKRFAVGASYSYLQRDSNFPGESYDDEIIGLFATANLR